MQAPRDRTLSVKLLLLVVGTYIISLAALLAGSAYLTHDRMISDRVTKMQAVVAVAETAARLLEDDVSAHRLTRAQAIERFRTLIYATRYNGDDYLFVYDFDGDVIALGNDPSVQGHNRLDLRDATGKLLIREMLAKAAGDGGTLKYLYPRKPGAPAVPKLAYVRAFPPWNVLIGTGVYIGDVDAAFHSYLLDVAAVVFAALGIAGALATWIGREVAASVSERRAAEAKFIHLAHHDTLTGLPNRAYFNETLSTAVSRAARDPSDCVALLLCDLDRFKEVNDTYGHPAGDELLRQAAARMLGTIRKDDLLARLGGDEFAFALMAPQHPHQSDSLARRVVDVLSRPFVVQGHTVTVGVSVGIAMAPVHAIDPVELMKQADTALYVSKHRGGGTATVYDPSMSRGVQERHELEADLRQAGSAEFVVLYKPIIDLPARRAAGFEALIHWQHPVRGLLGPEAFIETAEECGLLASIGNAILRRACLDAAGWDKPMRVAVAVFAQQLQAADFPATVEAALREAGIAADRLELDIAERVMLTDSEPIRSALKYLRALGVHISLADFGTGYSSLSYLKKFPIDRIKIDQSFVRDLAISAEAEAMVRAVVSLGAILGIRTLAEGIETEDQAERASAAQCDEGQGQLFSPPVRAEDVAAVIDRFGSGTPAMETA